MVNERLLFSTQSVLAWAINERYYNGRHYAWCSTTFDGNYKFDPHFTPPSSTPLDIYRTLQNAALKEDKGCAKIHQNRLGILKGAKIRLNRGEIAEHEFEDIRNEIKNVAFRPFLPILYLIHFDRVETQLVKVEVKKRAHPMSAEFIVPNLGREDFVTIAP